MSRNSGAALVLAGLAAVALLGGASASPLWDYVHTADPTYSYTDTGIVINGTFPCAWQGHLVNMTSQSWMTPEFSDRSVWTCVPPPRWPSSHISNSRNFVWCICAWLSFCVSRHQLVIIRPVGDLNNYSVGAIYVTGGSNGDSPPDSSSEDVLLTAALSCATSTVSA